MANRSTQVVLQNRTVLSGLKLNLRRTGHHLDHGCWDVEPPELIGNRGEWASESNGFMTGTEGGATYGIEDIDGNPLGTLSLHWNNPFVGSNSYSASVTPQATPSADGFSVGYIGGGGNDARVTFVLLAGVCSVDSESGEIACVGISRLTARSQRYAAIWERRGGPSWQARHGLSGDEYQRTFDALAGHGYRLVHVSAYAAGAQDRYAALWEERGHPAWQARHGLNAEQYQQAFDSLGRDGYRLVQVSGGAVGQEARYAALWERREGPAWQARHGLTAAQYQQTFGELTGQGYRLVDVSGYEVAGHDRYAAIWEQRSGPAWQARHGLSSQQYQQTFNEMAVRGYRLVRVSGYSLGGDARYAAIWEQSDGPAWQARHGLSAQQYQETFDQLRKDGYRLVQVSGYEVAD